MHHLFTLAVSYLAATSIAHAADVKLVVAPKCASSPTEFGDINVGVKPLSQFKNVVVFGDSYSQGGRTTSNGAVWTELLSKNATQINYANTGALADYTQYPGYNPGATKDFQQQIQQYAEQEKWSKLNPADTLYTVFFGPEDFIKSKDFANPESVAVSGNVGYGLLQLTSYPFYAKNILIVDNYGRGRTTEHGNQYRSEVYLMVEALSTSKAKTNVAFANLANVWDGVLKTPGHRAFGYTSIGPCVTSRGVCPDPAHTFYWKDQNPTTATHKLIAEYVSKVVAQC